jgi:hypothetical protein
MSQTRPNGIEIQWPTSAVLFEPRKGKPGLNFLCSPARLRGEIGGGNERATARRTEQPTMSPGGGRQMPVNDPTIEEAKRMAARRLGRQLAEMAASYARPIYWPVRSGSASGDEIRNGTTFFVDSGDTVFGVTAGHVFDQFAETATAGHKCQIGESSQLLDLRKRLIARGKTVDIATYRIDRSEIALTGATILTGWQSTWPPKPPEVDRGLVYAGFPGVDRRLLRPRVIEWGIWHGSE